MSHSRWIRVTTIDNIPPREGRAVRLGDLEIAIFNLGPSTALGASDFRAIDNRCPHSGGPLCDGIVTGHAVVCPLHGWKINLDSGAVDRPSIGAGQSVCTYATRVDDGVVAVEVPIAKEHAA